MSTELGTITGRFEQVTSVEKREVKYRESRLSLVSFSGGKVNGKMLQLTIQQDDGDIAYVQLTREQVKELAAKAVDFLL